MTGPSGSNMLVAYASEAGIAVLTLARPPVNALSTGMWEALSAALERAAADREVRVVVLTAEGTRAFSAGMDTKEAAGLSARAAQARTRTVRRGLRALARFPVPIVCAINAAAVGGGLNIAALCDVRIAADRAHFSLPEIDHGRVAGGGVFLRRIGVPEGVLREMLLTGRRLSAAEALTAHVVDEVVPGDALVARAMQIATAIAAKPPGTARAMKRAILAATGPVTGLFATYVAADRAASRDPWEGRR